MLGAVSDSSVYLGASGSIANRLALRESDGPRTVCSVDGLMLFHVDDCTTQDCPNPRIKCQIDSIEKPRYPLSGCCGIDDRKYNCFIPELGAGPKDSDYQIDLIINQILRENRGQRVLMIVADCGPLIRNRALAYALPSLLVVRWPDIGSNHSPEFICQQHPP